jgi:hypothetical protein
MNRHNQLVRVALDVEHNTISRKDIRTLMASLDVVERAR